MLWDPDGKAVWSGRDQGALGGKVRRQVPRALHSRSSARLGRLPARSRRRSHSSGLRKRYSPVFGSSIKVPCAPVRVFLFSVADPGIDPLGFGDETPYPTRRPRQRRRAG